MILCPSSPLEFPRPSGNDSDLLFNSIAVEPTVEALQKIMRAKYSSVSPVIESLSLTPVALFSFLS